MIPNYKYNWEGQIFILGYTVNFYCRLTGGLKTYCPLMATFLCLLKQNIPLGCKDNKQPLEILDIFCNRYSNFLSKAFPIICYRKVLYTKVTKVFPVIAIAIPHNSVIEKLRNWSVQVHYKKKAWKKIILSILWNFLQPEILTKEAEQFFKTSTFEW